MVQSVPNLAQLQGRILEISEAEKSTGLVSVMIEVESVEDVPGNHNMLAWAKGGKLTVMVPADRSAALKTGDQLTCHARKDGPRQVSADGDSIAIVPQ